MLAHKYEVEAVKVWLLKNGITEEMLRSLHADAGVFVRELKPPHIGAGLWTLYPSGREESLLLRMYVQSKMVQRCGWSVCMMLTALPCGLLR